MQTPDFSALKEISSRLKKAGIKHALGGSGLMASLGLVKDVRDWDLTTDAEWETVEPLLKGLSYEVKPPTELFPSKYLCVIKIENTSIDLIGGFAIRTSSEVFNVPTLVIKEWEEVPVGSPAVWAKAYSLMGRFEKSNLLLEYLKQTLK